MSAQTRTYLTATYSKNILAQPASQPASQWNNCALFDKTEYIRNLEAV